MNILGPEHLPYVTGLIVSFIYVYILKSYNIRRRRYEESIFFILIFTLLIPLIIALYAALTRNFNFSFIFKYTYRNMPVSTILSSTLYSYPISYFLAIYASFLIYIRIRYAQLNRPTVRKTYINYIIFIIIVLVLYSVFPSFSYYSGLELSNGEGAYPFFTDPVMTFSLFFLYVSIIAGFLASSYYISGWIYRVEILESFSRKMILIMGFSSSLAFILRSIFIHLHYIQDGFFSWNIITFSSMSMIILSLLYLEILSIRGKRVLGSLSYTAYVTLATTLILISNINPENLGLSNNINLYSYVLILVLVTIGAIVASGYEIFKRFFLPWEDNSLAFLERFPSIMGYILATLLTLFLFLNISIYSTIGGLSVAISKYYNYYLVLTLGLSPFISLSSSLITKVRNKLSVVSTVSLTIIIILYGVLLLNNGPNIIIYSMLIGYFLSIPVSLYAKKHKSFPVSRLLLISVMILLFLGATTFQKGPIEQVQQGSVYKIEGVGSFNISSIKTGVSTEKVYGSISGNETEMFRFDEVILNNMIPLKKLYYPTKEFTYFINYYIDKLTNSYYVCLSSINSEANSAYLYYIKTIESPIYYLVLLIFLVVSIVLTENEHFY